MVLGLMLQGWHRDHLNPHVQPRSMRGAIEKSISTFLVGSKDIANAEYSALKIDTLSRVPQFRDVYPRNALRRTLNVKSKYCRISEFKSTGSGEWLRNPSNPAIVSTIEDSTRKTRSLEHTQTIPVQPAS